MPEPPDGSYVLVGEVPNQELYVRDDDWAARHEDDGHWYQAFDGQPGGLSFAELVGNATADRQPVARLYAADQVVAVLPDVPADAGVYVEAHRDPVTDTVLRWAVYPYGGGVPDVGLQVGLANGGDVLVVRMPYDTAEAFLLAALAALRAGRRAAEGGAVDAG
jgi:hypothetical protein